MTRWNGSAGSLAPSDREMLTLTVGDELPLVLSEKLPLLLCDSLSDRVGVDVCDADSVPLLKDCLTVSEVVALELSETLIEGDSLGEVEELPLLLSLAERLVDGEGEGVDDSDSLIEEDDD